MSNAAKGFGLEVLLEVHNLKELKKSVMPSLDIIGVNNRNLKTFEVSLNTSRVLIEEIPDDFVKISDQLKQVFGLKCQMCNLFRVVPFSTIS